MTQEAQAAEATTELRSSPPPATTLDLKKAFPDSDAQFREEMTDLGATVAEAQGFWIEKLDKDKAAQAKEIEQLKAQAERPGVDPVGTKAGTGGSASGDGDAIQQFGDAVRERMKTAGMGRKDAVIAVARANPELHDEYLKATNPRQVHDLIDQRRKLD